MGKFEVINQSSLRDNLAVAKVSMYMACHPDSLLDTSGRRVINILYRPLWPDKNVYIVTDYVE